MNGIGQYVGEESGPCEVRRATITERLTKRKEGLERQLSEVSEALSALEANPELQKLFDIVSKVA